MTANLQRCRRITHLLSLKSLTASIRRSLHEGPDTVEELLDRHLVKEKKPSDDDEEELLTRRRRLTSTRRESLSLYRDILRVTRFFTWADSRGVLWRDVLRANARKEFEEARFEKDPEVVTRLLIGGRDAVQQALDKLVEKQKQLLEQERSSSLSRWYNVRVVPHVSGHNRKQLGPTHSSCLTSSSLITTPPPDGDILPSVFTPAIAPISPNRSCFS